MKGQKAEWERRFSLLPPERERERESQTDSERVRQTHRETDTDTLRQPDTEREDATAEEEKRKKVTEGTPQAKRGIDGPFVSCHEQNVATALRSNAICSAPHRARSSYTNQYSSLVSHRSQPSRTHFFMSFSFSTPNLLAFGPRVCLFSLLLFSLSSATVTSCNFSSLTCISLSLLACSVPCNVHRLLLFPNRWRLI